MEPIKINVNVEVSLSEATIGALGAIFCPVRGQVQQAVPAPAPETPQPKKAEPVAAAPESTAVEDDDDLPPDDAPDPVKTYPSEDDARKAVKAAKDRKVPAKRVRDYMVQNFNITSSVECPAERRQELIDGLNKLSA